MGIEYKAVFHPPLSEQDRLTLLSDLRAVPGMTCISAVGDHSLEFQYKGQQLRETWPEDCTIDIIEKDCYVVFHTGSLAMQNQILLEVGKLLKRRGYEADFDEL